MGCARTRLSVRRLCSPFTESNPSAMAASGRKNPKKATNEGSGSCCVVKSFKYTNGSSATVARSWREATNVAANAVRKISSSSSCMRTLLRWSASSLMTTAHNPVQGDPSRFMVHLPEVAGVDFVQGWAFQRQPEQVGSRSHDPSSHLGPAIHLRLEPELTRPFLRQVGDAGDRPQCRLKAIGA